MPKNNNNTDLSINCDPESDTKFPFKSGFTKVSSKIVILNINLCFSRASWNFDCFYLQRTAKFRLGVEGFVRPYQ